MKEFWNERFSKQEYAYGTEPNEFLKSQLPTLKPGRILFPAEGEGRNAVFAATLGWDVVAFDNSEEGRRKALELASAKGVTIDYRLMGYDEFEDQPDSYDAIGLVFAHTDPSKRASYHSYFIELLKPGGYIILQGFSPNQLSHTSGGPKSLDMLYTPEMLKDDFKGLSNIEVTEADIELNEGVFHIGRASVIQFFGQK
jgi:cyclopropane fatty-acyl-phospholipid synthase-like methyltransferase